MIESELEKGGGRLKRQFVTPRVLGTYLVVEALYQIGIYFWPGGPPLNLDPRVGLFGLLVAGPLRLGDHTAYIIEWVSGIWLLCLGGLILLGRHFLKTYILSEILLAAPTLLFLGVFSLGGHMRFNAADLLPFLCMFIPFSAVPLCLAIYCLSKGGKQPSGRVNT